MEVRVNLMMPELLYKESLTLVKKGMFSNYSELVRQAVRDEVTTFKKMEWTENDLRLREVLDAMKKNGQLLSSKEAAKYGIKV